MSQDSINSAIVFHMYFLVKELLRNGQSIKLYSQMFHYITCDILLGEIFNDKSACAASGVLLSILILIKEESMEQIPRNKLVALCPLKGKMNSCIGVCIGLVITR